MTPTNPQHLRRLRFVTRWGVVPVIKPQTVAEHSFHVAWIYLNLCEFLHYAPSVSEITGVLVHDSLEAVTGDIPSPNKPEEALENMSVHARLLKLSDLLEALMYINEEQGFGAQHLDEISAWLGARVFRFIEDLAAGFNINKTSLLTHIDALLYDVNMKKHPCLEQFKKNAT